LENEFLFSAFAFDEKVNDNLLKFELSLFKHVIIPKDDLKHLCGLFGTTNSWNPRKSN
jgi:hypothetical protein